MILAFEPALSVLFKGGAVILIHPAAIPFFHSLCFGMDILHHTALGNLPGHVDGAALHPLLSSGAVPIADSDLKLSIAPLLN